MLKVVICVILCIPTAVFSAKILAVFSVPSISHQIVYSTLTRELHKRGHELTVITPNPLHGDFGSNYTEIDTSFLYKIWNEKMVAKPKDLKLIQDVPEVLVASFTAFSWSVCRSYFNYSEIQNLIHGHLRFDLVLTEYGVNPCMYAFARLSDYKQIGIFSFQTNPLVHSDLGNPVTASYIPDVNFPYTSSMNFWKRARTLFFQGFMWVAYAVNMWTHDYIVKNHFPKDTASIFDIERNLSALLINTHFTMSYPRPYVPNFVEIGGPPFHLNNKKPSSLPKVSFLLV